MSLTLEAVTDVHMQLLGHEIGKTVIKRVSKCLCIPGKRRYTQRQESQIGSVRLLIFLKAADVQIGGNKTKFALKQVPENLQTDVCTPH